MKSNLNYDVNMGRLARGRGKAEADVEKGEMSYAHVSYAA